MTRGQKNVALAALVIVVVAVALWLYLGGRDFIAIDRCLDQGGAWNYEARKCDFGTPAR